MKHQASKRISKRQRSQRRKNQNQSTVAQQRGTTSHLRGRRKSSNLHQSARSRRRSGGLVRVLVQLVRIVIAGGQGISRLRVLGQPLWMISLAAFGISFLAGQGLGMLLVGMPRSPFSTTNELITNVTFNAPIARPQLSPLPSPQETWTCDVVVIGGSLGGVAAASHAMQSGATTCLIELTPWLGGQISSQGVSALDESKVLRSESAFSQSWNHFKDLLTKQTVELPKWTGLPTPTPVSQINSCWVGLLCFPPKAGATASEQLLKASVTKAPTSRWSTSTAFKGAEFDKTGRMIIGIYAVKRIPRDRAYMPKGQLSAELPSWYAWENTSEFEKIPLKLQPPPGKQLLVIDATDTNELIGWARVPYRLGSDSLATTGEPNASRWDNADCTQAFTYPFAMAIRDDGGTSLKTLEKLESVYPKEEHRSDYDLQGFPVFTGRSFFNYRRIVSTAPDDPYTATPQPGDITAVNWNRGNDWKFMDPPLIMNTEALEQSGQRQNWMGGLSLEALKHGEFHALLFAHWLMEHHSKELPLTYLAGADSPMGTRSGLSMTPYIREGRRIAGQRAYNQREFAIREADLRRDMQGGRDFTPTAIARIHYSIDIHGCRYRESEHDGEASSASVLESAVRPTLVPLEALLPQGIDNLLVGGKGIAVTHIANGMTRIHQGEWSIGAASGAIAGWLVKQPQPNLKPGDILTKGLMSQVRSHLKQQGLGFDAADDRPS